MAQKRNLRLFFAAGLGLALSAIAAACSSPEYTIPRAESTGGKSSQGGASGTAMGGEDGKGGTSAMVAGGTTASGASGGTSGTARICRTNDDCSGLHAARICDTATGSCVECLPGNDTCGAGLYCGTDEECHIGCRANSDCGTGSCDSATHRCKECKSSADCSLGTVCNEATGFCVPGCDGATSCPTGFTCCASECVNLYLDEGSCGSCGTSCSRANATVSCQEAVCVIQSCAEGYRDCNGQALDGCEADLLAQSNNCGACGVVCSESQVCRAGACASAECNQGFVDCDGNPGNGCETNIDRDVQNCGACDSVCSTAYGVPSCTAGSCTITCISGWGDCDQNPNNGCEVDLSVDATHCGRCDIACTNDHGSVECSSSRCVPSCGTGFGDCDGAPANGCEATLLTDAANCGACGKLCTLPHATSACTAGRCTVAACESGWADCNGLPDDGCEINLQTDQVHCGSCDVSCSNNNGTPSCAQGKCSIACKPSYGDCDKIAANGCEVNLDISVANCSTCGQQCPIPSNGSATCDKGVCGVSSCAAPFADCDKNPSNGCESNSTSDVNNCGGCGTPCNLAHAGASCKSGTCAIASCDTGWGDCNGIVADGCEVNLLQSLSHCGSCNAACAPADAVPACLGGTCTVASCSSGFQDCNKDVKDGCEINTQTSVGNCGGCGAACSAVHGTPSCSGGNCSIVCAAGYGNCDGDVSTGCETSTSSSTNHCNGCGKVCAPKNAAGACENSTCVIASCNTSFRDCDGSYSTGCEANVTTDTSNCQTCKNVCDATNGTPTCTASGCSITCNSGYADCTTSAGCETDTLTDEANCGGCGRVCNTTCIDGVCATPCTGLCSNPTVFTIPRPTAYHSPTIGVFASCFETTGAVSGGGCSNCAPGRTVHINGTLQSSAGSWQVPAMRNNGYCIQFGAGQYDYAGFTAW